MKKLFSSSVVGIAAAFFVAVTPLPGSAAGCLCVARGEIGPAPCVNVTSTDECGAVGQAMAETKLRAVQCSYYIDDACPNTKSSIPLAPIPAPTGPASESTMLGGGGNMGPGTTAQPQRPDASSNRVPPGFPEPKIVIPTLNIKIPGLTDFVAPISGDCSAALTKLGITSCKVFPWIGQYISAVYNFGVAIAAFLAVVIIMWGGFLYITASGISSQAEHGKQFIQGAFLGLVLVFGSYILLSTINPALVKFEGLRVPDVPARGSVPDLASLPGVVDEGYEERGEVDDADLATASGASEQPLDPFGGKGILASQLSPGATPTSKPRPPSRKIDCNTPPRKDLCPGCVMLPSAAYSPNNVTYQGIKKVQPCGRVTDSVDPNLAPTIQGIIERLNQAGPANAVKTWYITEAWPPTVEHDSPRHRNGQAIDLALTGTVTEERIASMERVLCEFKRAGKLGCVLNEYKYRTNKRDGPHFHIETGSCQRSSC